MNCDSFAKKGTGTSKKGTKTLKKGTEVGLRNKKRGLDFSYVCGLMRNSPLFLKIIN